MAPAGLKAYERKDPKRTGIYSFENRPRELAPAYEKTFRANKKAWKFFEKQPAGYKRLMIYRVMEAKQEETKQRRLAQLIEASAKGLRYGVIIPASRK